MKKVKTKRITKKENELVKENMEAFNKKSLKSFIDYVEVSFNPASYSLEVHITIGLERLQDCVSFLGNEEAKKFIGNAILATIDRRIKMTWDENNKLQEVKLIPIKSIKLK